MSPRPIVTGSISTKTRRTAGSRQSIDEAQSSVEAAKPRERQQHLDHRADQDRDRVDVELRVERFGARDAEDEPAMIARFQKTGVSAGTVKCS